MLNITFDELERRVLGGRSQTVALACADSEEALRALEEARQKGIVAGILVGRRERIEAACARVGADPANYALEEAADAPAAAARAVQLVHEGRAQLLMKGMLETGSFLRAVLSSATGLRTDRRLCSVAALECRSPGRLLILADVGTNIAPTLEEKASILDSCGQVARALGCQAPKAAALCALEKVDRSAMPATVDAALLAKMAERHQLRGDLIVEGPISMDLAVSESAAAIKRFGGRIQGDADILLAPDLEAGNILIKGLMYLSGDIRVAGVGMGAAVPLIISSRGDDSVTKYYSIVLAALISQSGVMR